MKKLMILLLGGVVFLLSVCFKQQTEALPQWVMSFVDCSHSIFKQDKELLSQDFSGILADKRVDFIGYFGKDYQKMDIIFQTVKKESDTSYLISGFSKISDRLRPFSGSLHILDVRELNEYDYGVDDFMKGQIHKQGICIAHYNLKEERGPKDSGTFSGISVFRWYLDKNDDLHYDHTNEESDNYSNNLFAGIWQSNSGAKPVKCAWGQYRIPDSGDLDIGTAEFMVNPIYAPQGWKDHETPEW